MTRRIRISAPAQRDIDSAKAWYADQGVLDVFRSRFLPKGSTVVHGRRAYRALDGTAGAGRSTVRPVPGEIFTLEVERK